MELRHLRYFVMAAAEANISRAAARLNVTQPAVSRQIRDLEEELGTELFRRERNGLALTSAGQTALAYARDILRRTQDLEVALRPFAEDPEPVSLKIGYIPTALPGFLSSALRRFNEMNHGVCVQIFEMSPTQQEAALQDRTIDLAFLGDARRELRRAHHVEVIRRVPVAAAVPDRHPLARRKTIELGELATESFLTLDEKRFPGRSAWMEALFQKAGIAPRVILAAGGLSEILGMIGTGSGVALVPADIEQLPHPGVVFLRLRRPTHQLKSCAAWRKDQEIPAIQEIIALLREEQSPLAHSASSSAGEAHQAEKAQNQGHA